MKMSFRWYGESDPISLQYIRQIPNMRSIVSAVYDVAPGEVWPEESLARIGRERTHTEIYEKKEILEAVRRQFLHVFEELDDKTVIIDTTGQSIDEVAKKVAEAVESL